MRKKLHIKNKNVNNDKKNKGFSLIEVLAVIVIIAVISGVGITIYLNTIKNSKEKATILATNNITDAAETYSKEYNEIKWLNSYETSNDENNLKVKEEFVCITVNELINNGYFKNDFYKNEIYEIAKITGNTYVKIVRDNTNKANYKINVLLGVTERNKCELTDNDIQITIADNNRYTDTLLDIYYKDKYANNSQTEITYSAHIKETNNNGNKQNQDLNNASNGKFTFTELKNNTRHTISVCSTIDEIQTCSSNDFYTTDFVDSIINVNPQTGWFSYKDVTIRFDDKNIYELEDKPGRHYFYSEANGTLDLNDDGVADYNVKKCSTNKDELKKCSGTTTKDVKNIESGIWYYTSDDEVIVRITENIGENKKKLYAKVLDTKGNISKEVNAEFNLIDNSKPSIPESTIRYINNTGTIRENNNESWTNQTLWWGDFKSEDTGGSGLSHYEYATNCNADEDGILQSEYTYSTNKNTKYCIRAVDKAGNISEWSSANYFKIDKSAPGIPTSTIRYASSTGTVRTNANTWTNQTLWWGNFSATDTGDSGINHYEYSSGCSGSKSGNLGNSYTYPLNSATSQNSSFCIRAVDNAGNTSSWSSTYYFKIDKEPPTCTVSGGSSSWTKNDVTVTGTCSDTGGSNCKSNSVSITKTTDTNTSVSPGTVEDNAGNKTTCGTKTVKIDKTTPTTPTYTAKYASSGSTYTSGTWTNSKVNTVISSTDSGSGINNMQYSSDKSSWSNLGFSVSALTKSGTTWTGTEPWTLKNRNDTYYFRACDSVGNCSGSSSKFNVKYDITAPTCTSSKSNTYTTSGVTASFTCDDNSSGVVSCTSKENGLTSTKSYTIKDSAGNSGTCKVTVNAGTRYKYRTCSACSRCAAGGCKTWPDWSTYYLYKSRIATSAACTSAKPANTNTYKYICRAPITTYNYTSFYQIHRITCSQYSASCVNCGCDTWNSWTGYTSSSCSEVLKGTKATLKDCSSAYVYW